MALRPTAAVFVPGAATRPRKLSPDAVAFVPAGRDPTPPPVTRSQSGVRSRSGSQVDPPELKKQRSDVKKPPPAGAPPLQRWRSAAEDDDGDSDLPQLPWEKKAPALKKQPSGKRGAPPGLQRWASSDGAQEGDLPSLPWGKSSGISPRAASLSLRSSSGGSSATGCTKQPSPLTATAATVQTGGDDEWQVVSSKRGRRKR